ncbi:MAG: outer membrane lipoprotein carrier protein LolA [Myxococcales bacterium]|nr:outer membrane lipoprotein carrier protein LolA [Myxococcales bacterium]
MNIGLLLALATGFAPDAQAADTPHSLDADTAKVVASVQKKYATVEVLRANFVQVAVSDLYGREEQRGTLVLQRPGKMRWTFAGSGREFVTDGETMWIHNPEAKQVLRFQDFSAQASTVDSLLQSLHKVGELFEVASLPAEGSGARLSLVPKEESAKAQVKALELQLDAELVLRKLVITDAFGAVTDLSFTDVTLGGEIGADTFRFQIPPGVEVIDANGAG